MSANCPHCARDLAKNQAGKHCRPTDSTTCTWLNCRCGSVVDVKTGNHICPSNASPCAQKGALS